MENSLYFTSTLKLKYMFEFFKNIKEPTVLASKFNKLYEFLLSLADAIDNKLWSDKELVMLIESYAFFARKEIINRMRENNIDMSLKMFIGSISNDRITLQQAHNVTIKPLIILAEKYGCDDSVMKILYN